MELTPIVRLNAEFCRQKSNTPPELTLARPHLPLPKYKGDAVAVPSKEGVAQKRLPETNAEVADLSRYALYNPQPLIIECDRNIVRSGAILSKQDEYYVGVERMIIPLQTLPLFVFQPSPDAMMDGISTTCSLTATYNGFTVTVPLQIIPSTVFTVPVQQPFNYWYIYDRNTLAQIKTNALTALCNVLNASFRVPALGQFPYITYNPQSQLERFYGFPLGLYDLTYGTVDVVQFWFNGVSLNLWGGWPTIAPNPPLPVQNQQMAAYINLLNDGTNSIVGPNPLGGQLPVAYPAILFEFTQSNVNNQLYSPQTIELRTNLSVIGEFSNRVPIPNEPVSSNDVLPILTDFQLDLASSPQRFRDPAVFNAGGLGNIRWCRLTSNAPLTNLLISVWWVDSFGDARQLFVINQLCSIKLAFVRRDLLENGIFKPTDNFALALADVRAEKSISPWVEHNEPEDNIQPKRQIMGRNSGRPRF